MRVDDATLHVEGTVAPRRSEPAYLFARRRGDAMEVVAPARSTAGASARASTSPSSRCPATARRLEPAARSRARRYRLGTHLDGIPNRGEATEYPAGQRRRAPLRPYYTVENNVSVRSETGGERRARRAEADEEPSPGWPAALLGPPAILVHRLALRLAGAAARRRAARRARRPHPRAPRVGDGRHRARGAEPRAVAGGERPLGRDRERRAAAASGRSSRSPTASR